MKSVTKAVVTELKAGHKYIIALNSFMVTKSDAVDLAKTLDELGFRDCIVMLFKGDPKDGLQVIEQKDAARTT